MNRLSAFTLVEVLIATVLSMALATVLGMIYVTTFSSLAVVNNLAALTSQFQATSEQMERDLHVAVRRISGACGAYNSATDLILEAPGIGGAGVDRVVFVRSGNRLERILLDATCAAEASRRVLARDVVSVDFSVSGSGKMVEARLQLQNQSSPHPITSTLAIHYRLRN